MRYVVPAWAVAVAVALFNLTIVAGMPASAAPGTPGSIVRSAQVAAGGGYGPAAVLAGMSEQQRVGQLFMAGVPAAGPIGSATSTDVTTYHTGSVILTGRSSAGVAATRQLTGQLQGLATSAATGGVPLLVGTDQEGGYVQVLSGPGFSAMPTALSQGTEPAWQLRGNADKWGASWRRRG
jgi:beta-N-acetylhexosaminidase